MGASRRNRSARMPKAATPQPLPHPDPAPPDSRPREKSRIRQAAPVLLAALIHDTPLPAPIVRPPLNPAVLTRRQKAAAKKRAARDAQHARDAVVRDAIAAQAEIDAEKILPAAQRDTITGCTARSLKADAAAKRDPTPIVLRPATASPHPRTGGFLRTDPLALMCRKGERSRTVTNDHLRAKRRLLDDYHTGILQTSAPRSITASPDGATGQGEEYAWLVAADRFRAAMAAVGPSLRGIVEAMALLDWTVERLATQIGASQVTTTGLIVAAFDCLADHYWPGRETRAAALDRAVAAALRPLGFDFAVNSHGSVISAERMGMGRLGKRISGGAQIAG